MIWCEFFLWRFFLFCCCCSYSVLIFSFWLVFCIFLVGWLVNVFYFGKPVRKAMRWLLLDHQECSNLRSACRALHFSRLHFDPQISKPSSPQQKARTSFQFEIFRFLNFNCIGNKFTFRFFVFCSKKKKFPAFEHFPSPSKNIGHYHWVFYRLSLIFLESPKLFMPFKIGLVLFATFKSSSMLHLP